MAAKRKYFDEETKLAARRYSQARWKKENIEEVRASAREYARVRLLRRTEAVAGRPKPATCEVCGAGGKICFDHDHKTGKFRGWICVNCNSALGHARDNIEVFQKLIAYLQTNNLFK